jgi:iron-sulfur cluster repair protein YtfE (RIC family)
VIIIIKIKMDTRFHVSNKDNFERLLEDENLAILRREICRHLMKENESDFYDITEFNRMYVGNMNLTNILINRIVTELQNLGWNTFLGFGGTGLYIYSTNDLPHGVY